MIFDNVLETFNARSLFEEKYENGSFPDLVFKDPELDNRKGIQFWRNIQGLKERKDNRPGKYQYVEKFIISDKLYGIVFNKS